MRIHEMVEKIIEEIVSIRREIHMHPELSFNEFNTTEMVEKKLREWGISTSREGLETGLIGLIQGGKPGKTIALRADMDALPINEDTGLDFASVNQGASHSCGHDIHTSILIGCAKVLSEISDEIKGNIKLVFQPAEERMGGANMMLQNGFMNESVPDAVLGCHCWPEIPVGSVGIRRGAIMAASDEIVITVQGKSGHAAHPHKCVDPIVVASYLITQIQTIISRETRPVDSGVITFGQISGGTAPNIIPKEVVIKGTIRTINPETRQRIHNRINNMAVNHAEAMNASCEVEIIKGTPPLINDDNMINLVEGAVEHAEGVQQLIELKEPSMGSEDFSFYLEKVPGAFLRIGTSNDFENTKLPLHNPGIVFDEGAIAVGIETICETTLRFLEQ